MLLVLNSIAEPGSTSFRQVGYHVRLDACSTSATRLLFCTTGILLRKMQGDPLLSDVSHVVLDEVHERSVQGDFLATLLRDLIVRRRTHAASLGLPPLKVRAYQTETSTNDPSPCDYPRPVLNGGWEGRMSAK
jgi:hypothetical protein